MLPRGEPVLLTRAVFISVRRIFDLRLKRAKSYEERDRAMALYSPISLVLLMWLFDLNFAEARSFAAAEMVVDLVVGAGVVALILR